jgi:hypothetical protein
MPSICGLCHLPVSPDAKWCPHCKVSFKGTEEIGSDELHRLVTEGEQRVARIRKAKFFNSIIFLIGLILPSRSNPLISLLALMWEYILKVICMPICWIALFLYKQLHKYEYNEWRGIPIWWWPICWIRRSIHNLIYYLWHGVRYSVRFGFLHEKPLGWLPIWYNESASSLFDGLYFDHLRPVIFALSCVTLYFLPIAMALLIWRWLYCHL